MADYRIISSDNHVFEPGDLWTSRVSAKYKDLAPRVVNLGDDSGDMWVVGEQHILNPAAGAETGERFETPEATGRAHKMEDLRPGGYIPEEHVKDMDIDGVDISIIYPTFGLLVYCKPMASDLLDEIFRAYNDWIAEFCQAHPSRLKGIANINVDDPKLGAKELERAANMGLIGALIPVHLGDKRRYSDEDFEYLWAAGQDLQMPLGLHSATNRPGPLSEWSTVQETGLSAAFFTQLDFWVRMSISDIIFSGVFERYPNLWAGAVEHELGWIPHFVERMDYTYTQRPFGALGWHRFKGAALPSDFFRNNIFAGFQEDALGIELREKIGVDNLMWGSDYPHIESTFPRSREILEEILADCSLEEKEKIAGKNAARIYRLD